MRANCADYSSKHKTVQQTKRYRSTWAMIALGALVLHLCWLLLWAALSTKLLPAPWLVYAHLSEVFASGLPEHLLASLGRILWGIGLSMLLAFVLALVMFRYKAFGRVLDAFIYLTYPVPKLALLPIVMLLGGLGEGTKVAMIVLIILFQLVLSLRDSLRSIPRESFAITRSLGAGSSQTLRHILLPATLPATLSALRVALGTAISVLFVTETYGTARGMGYYIVDAWMRIHYLDMYGGIVVLSLVGFVLFVLIDLVETLLCPWHRSSVS